MTKIDNLFDFSVMALDGEYMKSRC